MHEKALTNESAALLPSFGRFDNFYLAGGTALALQIGHRLSVDFDFFSYNQLPENLLKKVKRIFEGRQLSVTYSSPEQLNLIIDGVKVTFFNYPYQTIYPFVSYGKIKLASVLEIALMKSFSIGKRLSYKDYVDWYFMITDNRVSLSAVIEGAKKKFGMDFNDRLFLGQLVSMEDIPPQKIDFLKEQEQVSKETVEQALKIVVKEFLEK